MLHRLAFAAVLGAACILAGCAATAPGEGGAPAAPGPSGGPRMVLAPTAEAVRTVQLFRTGDETAAPIVGLRSGETLTLAFDVLGDAVGEPLAVHFYHADRTWRRDLLPTEYLRSFTTDDIRSYEMSLGTAVRYVHYTYTFPNANIGFLLSGNYVVRVTRPGEESRPLLERAFFVTEEAAEVDVDVRSTFGDGAGLVDQPFARLRPLSGLDGAAPYDYTVCFARDGRFDAIRCAAESSLLEQSFLQFSLDRDAAFDDEGPLYQLDLGALQPGADIVDVDRSVQPFRVELDLDYARLAGIVRPEALTGQPVVGPVVFETGNPATQGEYVETVFRYVPEGEREAPGPVFVTGSFNGWQLDPAYRLTWDAAAGRYEGAALVKQGLYTYRYVVDAPGVRPPASAGQPSRFTALVYYTDARLFTDRLVGVRQALAP